MDDTYDNCRSWNPLCIVVEVTAHTLHRNRALRLIASEPAEAAVAPPAGERRNFRSTTRFSKSIDNVGANTSINNAYCFSCDRALSYLDTPNAVNLSGRYELPFGI